MGKSNFELYSDMRKQYPDRVLLFHQEETYETFGLDAILCQQVLGTLIASDIKGQYPITWFAEYELSRNIEKLLKKGNNVAVIDEL